MTANTFWVVLAVAACLLSASARPLKDEWDPGREDICLTLTPGSETIFASWNVTLSNVTVTWKDQYDDGNKKFLGDASEALITNLRPATEVTVSVHEHSIENPLTAVQITRTLQQDIRLILIAGSENILAKWGVAYPRAALTWKDDSGRKGTQIMDRRSEATILNLKPCTFVTVSIRPEDSDKSSLATETTRTSTKAPPGVSSLQSLYTTAQNVSLAWKPPDTKCLISNYNITYSGVVKSGKRNRHFGTEIIGHGDATNYTVDDLHPDTDYIMAVAARNEAGLGQQEFVNVSTPEGVPSRPSTLTSISHSSHSISLTWKEPEEPNGVLRNYSVSWYENGKEVGKTAVSFLTHTIVGLSPCVVYRVRVAAHTSAGEGEYKEVTQTTAAVPPIVHNAICSIAPDAQEVTMTWSKPDSACPITGYELFWQNDTEQSFASINASTAGPSPSYTVKRPSEEHSTVCVAAMLHEERGHRTCCMNNPHLKDSGGAGWLLTSLLIGIMSITVVGVVAVVLLVLLYRKLISSDNPQYKKVLAIAAPNK